MELNRFRSQFTDIADACALAQAIVDTVHEPVLVFDKDLRVIAASRSFYSVFKVSPGHAGPAALRAGRWPMGHSKASTAAGKNHTRAGRDGRL